MIKSIIAVGRSIFEGIKSKARFGRSIFRGSKRKEVVSKRKEVVGKSIAEAIKRILCAKVYFK